MTRILGDSPDAVFKGKLQGPHPCFSETVSLELGAVEQRGSHGRDCGVRPGNTCRAASPFPPLLVSGPLQPHPLTWGLSKENLPPDFTFGLLLEFWA